MTSQIIVGDALESLRTLESDSVQMVCTSPPYWGLRSYLPDEHPDKGSELGLESTPEEHVTAMVAVFEEVRRVLRPDGVLWLNYGDSFAASRTYQVPDSKHRDVGNNGGCAVPPGLKPKDLVGMPWMVAFALRAAGWWLRHNIVWAKGVSFCPGYSGSVMPESVTDRPTTSHEFVFLLTKSARYYYDADAVREGVAESTLSDPRTNGDGHRRDRGFTGNPDNGGTRLGSGPARNLRSVWCINPQPFPGSHFATFPEALVAPCILAGTSEYGACAACGKPWERVVEKGDLVPTRASYDHRPYGVVRENADMRDQGSARAAGGHRANMAYERYQKGFRPACACGTEERRPCVVLDPFCGSGTTGLVAARYGRSFVGIELNPEYADMARRRIAPALAQPALLEVG